MEGWAAYEAVLCPAHRPAYDIGVDRGAQEYVDKGLAGSRDAMRFQCVSQFLPRLGSAGGLLENDVRTAFGLLG